MRSLEMTGRFHFYRLLPRSPSAMERSKRERAAVSYREPGETDDLYVVADAPNQRKSGRKTEKEKPIDKIAVKSAPVPGGPNLTYSIGGAECGGEEANKILREVETDEGLLLLHSQFRACRRTPHRQSST